VIQTEADGRSGTRPHVRFVQAAIILCLAAGGVYFLSLRLAAQLHWLRGEHLFLAGNYSEAAEYLSKAAAGSPRDADIHRQLGNAWFKLAATPETDPEKHSDPSSMLIRARDAFLAAARLNPLDAQSFYGVAESEALLAQAYQSLHPYAPQTPYDPLPYFEAAVNLRPNGISYRYAMARYLAGTDDPARLASAVRRLALIYPPICARLKKEAFWSDALQAACLEGLADAIQGGVMPREAHMAASALMADQGRWPEAISHYETALGVKSFQNSPANLFHLGSLHLKNGAADAARETFLKGLHQSRDREGDLARIRGYYHREKDGAGFIEFYRTAAARIPFSDKAEILYARSLLALKRFDAAEETLAALIRKKRLPEAYYWLARTAEARQDWDAMELAAQKATILEADNSDYHALFARVLFRVKKYDRAERAAGLAIQYSKTPSPWLYNQRASIRYQKKDYEGALGDWEKAFSLKPDYLPFKKRIEELRKKIGEWVNG